MFKTEVIFVQMAYNRINHIKKIALIVEVYKSLKDLDKPDSRIVAQEFPKHGIFICYRTWMAYKAMKPSEYSDQQQLSLFA